MKKQILEKDRLFIFEMPVLGKLCDSKNSILDEIGQRASYWKRNKVNNNVNMSNINL